MTTLALALAPSSPEFGKLKSVAHEIMSQKQWSAAAVVALGGSLAAAANRLTGLSGLQKKQLVLDVIKVVLQESVEKSTDLSGSPEVVKSLNFVLEHVLPASLDLAVAAARGQLDLKKVKASVFAGCLACLPSLLGACGASSAQAQAVVSQVATVAKSVDPSLVASETASSPASESVEKEVSETETPQRKSSLGAGVVIRVPEATPPSESQNVESASQ
jgi:hypothetical protein